MNALTGKEYAWCVATIHFIDNLDERKVQEFVRANIDLTVRIDNVKVIKEALPERANRPASFRDVNYAFNPIHKVKENIDFFFIGNPTDCNLTAEVSFRSDFKKDASIELWNPHTGTIEKIHTTKTQDRRLSITLPLEPLQSRFFVLKN
jgi:hypothetical protein